MSALRLVSLSFFLQDINWWLFNYFRDVGVLQNFPELLAWPVWTRSCVQWYSGSAVRGTRFQFRPVHRLPWYIFRGFTPRLYSNGGIVQLFLKFFSVTILPFDALQPEVQRATSNTPQGYKRNAVWGPDCGECEYLCLLGCDTMLSGRTESRSRKHSSTFKMEVLVSSET
jgi:hypothetical protein